MKMFEMFEEWPVKQAITGNNYGDCYDNLPALQVEQVKRGCFWAIYEDNAWIFKPNSNDQSWKSMIEYLFFSLHMEEETAGGMNPAPTRQQHVICRGWIHPPRSNVPLRIIGTNP
ncbi:MAG: hypothetical protein H0X30_33865 [Anaerolineae bacterium]|nr:hypothetical protein [Anaerolineae bacterium]